MLKNTRLRMTTLFIISILVILAILFLIFDTNLFKNDVKHTFKEAVSLQTSEGNIHTKEVNGKFIYASKQDIEKAMQIKHSDNDLKYMDISQKVPMSEKEVNHILKGKGILENKGSTFIKAQDKYEVNILYLISHALVETGNGQSDLSKGIKEGNHHYYNFFGIGAFDEDAVKTGKSFAKQKKWTTPEKAIMGGAWFVRYHYFKNNQLSLYQMRWNPQNPGQHQYASDIQWANNIADLMEKYYDKYGIKKDHIRKKYYK